MRLVVRRAALAGALLLLPASTTGCAGLLGGRSEVRREVTVDLPVSRAEAVRRTLAMMREQGYEVAETLTSGSTPTTAPFRHGDAEAVFHAAITGGARSSRVVLTGTYRKRELGGLVMGRQHDVVRSDDPLERELWAKLDNLGVAIRRVAR
ncbi:MAG TPA: hypothetical protein VFJ78_05805 [Gaiellaceae bacterium]|nr:hypothetical protein [Gaiellaceae bacterium]